MPNKYAEAFEARALEMTNNPSRREFLYYMMSIENIESILEHGILSHEKAAEIAPKHEDISDSEVQNRRDNKRLPNGRSIHQCANVYFNARNAMLYREKIEVGLDKLCVVRLSYKIVDTPGVVFSSQNAATSKASFFTDPEEALQKLDFTAIFGRLESASNEKKPVLQAEVLIPDSINPSFIEDIIVGTETLKDGLQYALGEFGYENVPVRVNRYMFFERNK